VDKRIEDHEDAAARLARLQAEAEAAASRRDLAAEGSEASDGHHHPAEAATDADLRERELREQLRWKERQERLRQAQAAVDAGTYGICVDCGQPIPEGRLRAVPDAVRCVPCQTARGRRR
jgi:phage/conjugal plasmid C-4 type zinc finger TraR family protein